MFALVSIALTYSLFYILTHEAGDIKDEVVRMLVLHMFLHFFIITPYCLMTLQWGVLLWGLTHAKAKHNRISGSEQVSLQKGAMRGV